MIQRENAPGQTQVDRFRFMSSLATEGDVAASTWNQALSAPVFLYSEVLPLLIASRLRVLLPVAPRLRHQPGSPSAEEEEGCRFRNRHRIKREVGTEVTIIPR